MAEQKRKARNENESTAVKAPRKQSDIAYGSSGDVRAGSLEGSDGPFAASDVVHVDTVGTRVSTKAAREHGKVTERCSRGPLARYTQLRRGPSARSQVVYVDYIRVDSCGM